MQAELVFASSVSPHKLDASEMKENASPNGSISIKAWHGSLPSKIPSPTASNGVSTPADKMVKNKGLFSSPLPTPMSCAREDSLLMMEQQLETKLSEERKAQAAVLHRLDSVGSSTSVATNALKEEASKRSARIFVLSQKLTRTRRTLVSLQTAQADYHTSAKKVQIAEATLQAKSRASRLSSSETSKLRHELDEATTMMGAAFRRVEQIESITDALIQQLADTEAELAELHQIRDEEAAAHAGEVRRLASERNSLEQKLDAASGKVAALTAQDAQLKKELVAAVDQAGKLTSAVEAADKATTELERRLETERAELAATLQSLRVTQKELTADLHAKEIQLEEALQRANQGTPVGQGAKVVLPMALARIKKTQEALREEEGRSSAAAQEIARIKAQAAATEANLKLELEELDSERKRQVSEKQASLESMTRAAAAAAKEAAVKQEAVNKLASEVTSLDKERSDLHSELQDATHRCFELEAQLAEIEEKLSDACTGREAAQAEATFLQTLLDEAAADRDQLSAALKANSSHTTALETSIAEMRDRIEELSASHRKETENLRNAAATSEAHAADVKLQLAAASASQETAIRKRTQLEKKLHQQDASLAHLTAAVALGKERIAELHLELGNSHDAAAAQRIQLFQALQATEAQLSAAIGEREQSSKQLEESEAKCQTLEDSIATLQTQLAAAEESHLARVGELAAALEAGEKRLATTAIHLETAAAAQEAMEASIQGLQGKVVALEEENQSTRHALSDLECSSAESIDALRCMLQEALDSQTMLFKERESLEEQVKHQDASITDLRAALSSRATQVTTMESLIDELKETAAQRTSALSSQLQIVCEERDQLDRQRVKLADDLDHLARALQVKEAEVVAARAQGTPKGETSKQVLRLSFAKIKALQEASEEAKLALANKTAEVSMRDASIAELQATLRCKEELTADLHQRMDTAVEAAAALEKELDTEREIVEELTRANATLAPNVEALSRELVAAAEAQTAMADLNAQQSRDIESFESQLKESMAALNVALGERDAVAEQKARAQSRAHKAQAMLDAAYAEAEHKDAASKTVLKLSFQKIRGLEDSLERRATAVRDLEVQLDCAEDNAIQLAAALAAKTANLAHAERVASRVPGLEKDNASLERALCRLRLDVQQELEARHKAEIARDAAAEEAVRLQAEAEKLRKDSAILQEVSKRMKETANTAETARKIAEQETRMGAQAAHAEREVARKAQGAAEDAAKAATIKAEAAEAALKAVQKEGALKEAAAKEISRRAFEKIKALESAMAEQEAQMALATARATSLESQLDEAQSLLSEAKTRARGVDALRSDLDAASNQITELEGALSAARAEVSLLVSQRTAAATKSSSEIETLQTRVSRLQVELNTALKEADAARVEASTGRAQLHTALGTMEARMSRLSDAESMTGALVKERGELAAKVASLSDELVHKDENLAESSRLVAELSQALALQKETVETTKRLGVLREADAESSLLTLEEQILALHHRLEAESCAAKLQVAELEQAHKDQAAAKERALDTLRNANFRIDILERMNAELCAQIAEAHSERRRADAVFVDGQSKQQDGAAPSTESPLEVQSYPIPCVVELEDESNTCIIQERSSVRRTGRTTWAAVLACALAILWSTAAAGGALNSNDARLTL